MSLPTSSATPTSWLNALDHRRWRMLVAGRVFALAAGLGLSASTLSLTASATTFLALCGVAAVMSVPLPATWMRAWAALAEGALAALILSISGQDHHALLVYVVLPPLVAGIEAGRALAVAAVATQVGAALGGLVAAHDLEQAGPVVLALAPWLFAGMGMGLLGAWVRDNTPAETADHAGYESAHRLLEQLRSVARRLSSGLDTFALGQHTLDRFVDELDAHRAVLVVRSEGGASVPLNSHGAVPFFDAPEDDPIVRECWSHRAPSQRRVPSGSGQARNRIAFPLQVGPRVIGALVADRAEPADPFMLEDLQRFLDEQALKLESALLFEEVRSLATMEERQRLAREIHDGAAQEVASLGYLVDSLVDCTDTDEIHEVYTDLRRELSRIVGELRLSIFDLRSGISPHGGLGGALSNYAREVGARCGMAVHLAISEHPRRLPPEVETQFLRIAQEAINNARKHAQASNLWISLRTDSSLPMLRVEDDGVGMMHDRPDHFGLSIMRERAARVGATLTLGDRPGGGSSVSVALDRSPSSREGDHSGDLSAAC